MFRRDSIFEPMQEHGDATAEFAPAGSRKAPAWLHEARTMLPGPGRYLAFLDGEEIRIFPIEQGWTRIGRSAVADLRLDDPSVSRRHALVVSEAPKSLRVLDDRSLNGVLSTASRSSGPASATATSFRSADTASFRWKPEHPGLRHSDP